MGQFHVPVKLLSPHWKPRGPTATFTSYVGDNGDALPNEDDFVTQTPNSQFYPIDREDHSNLVVDLLPGEIRIGEAQVRRYVPYSDEKNGNIGRLFVTNFKVSFVTVKLDNLQESMIISSRRNKLIGADDIALANIEDIFYVTKGKRKRLVPGSHFDSNIKQLEIHCKDFQIHTFSLDFEAKSVVNALFHHAFPARFDLLFAFYYQGKPNITDDRTRICDYCCESDWQTEITRTKHLIELRVCHINDDLSFSLNFPRFFVVPKSLSDNEMRMMVRKMTSVSFPVWSYTHSNGFSLFRLRSGLSESDEKKLLHHILKLNSRNKYPLIIDVCQALPSMKDIQISYTKLREICMPPTCKDVWNTDATWLSMLESSQWLTYVNNVLSTVRSIVDKMHNGQSVVLKENDTNDYSAVTSSLVQLVMDPHCRSQRGFESLVEREWVVFGHCFADRCGLTAAKDNEQGPVFLLFLDCTWQLLQQFPSSFEFTEIYLTSVWDSVTLGLFRNFVYAGIPSNNHLSSPLSGGGTMLSVWDWHNQFDSDDIEMFQNPLYIARKYLNKVLPATAKANKLSELRPSSAADVLSKVPGRSHTSRQSNTWPASSSSNGTSSASQSSSLGFEHRVIDLRLWSHCYLRWLTPVQIVGGGTPSEYVAQTAELSDIIHLQRDIAILESSLSQPPSRLSTVRVMPSTFSPVAAGARDSPFAQHFANSQRVSSSYPFSPCRPSNPAAFFGAQVMPRLSYADDALSVDELSLGDVTVLGTPV